MWLIRTKLEAPAPTNLLISRPRLHRHLPAVLRHRITLVHAPAGFGKTSLLAEWQRCFRARRVRTAWLSLDEHDSEVTLFLAYLAASLDHGGLDVGHLGAQRGIPAVPAGTLIAAITRAIERSEGRTVVLIDDYHRLQGPAVDEALARLIDGSNSRVHFVIAARERPVSFAKKSGRGATHLELSGDTLRFAAEEARELLRRGMRAIADEDLDAIVASADGWPIALAAVRDWLANGWSVERARQSLARPAAELGHYITEQVLHSLSAPERDFLERTAIVDRYNEHLAATLADKVVTRDTTEALERRGLLVVVWDRDQRWFRYPRLLAEMAVAEFERRQPSEVAEMHRRAAEWFFNAGHHVEAIRHAVATRDDNLLAQLFERAGGWKLASGGNIGLTRDALTLIPLGMLRAHPRSHLASILVLIQQGSTTEVRQELQALTESHAARADPLLAAEIAVFDLGARLYEDMLTGEEQSAILARVNAAVPRDQTALRALLGTTSCIIRYDCGDLESAVATADEALASFRAVRSLLGEVFVHVHQGKALLEMGRLRDAQATLRQAWHLARNMSGESAKTEAIAVALLGLAEYESGNLDEAERLVMSALPTIEQGEGWFDLYASAYMAACALARHREGITAALAIVRRARQIALVRNLPRLQRFASMLEMRERVLGGEIASPEIAHLESVLAASANLEHAPRLRMRAALELARLALVRGQLSAASVSAVRLAEEAGARRHQRVQIEALITHSLALHGLEETERAARALDAAVSLAMHEGYRQVFVDVGVRLLPLLQTNDLVAPDRNPTRVRDRFLSAIMDDIRASQAAPDAAPDLSDRERTLLLLLGDGLSNKAVAKALQVSENTVKFHLKRLFAKLGVATRADAVAASETLPKS